MTSIVWLLIFYSIGFIAGYLSQKERIHDIVEETKKHIHKIYKNDELGIVERQTARHLYERDNPEGQKIKETEDAMKETLAKGIQELK